MKTDHNATHYGYDSESAYLNKDQNNYLTEYAPCGIGGDCNKTGNADRGGGGKECVKVRNGNAFLLTDGKYKKNTSNKYCKQEEKHY